MAIAESALRQFGLKGLQRSGVRGGNLLGTAAGIGIGIGWGLYQDYAMSVVPIDTGHWRQPKPGVALDYETPSNGSSNQFKQTLRPVWKRKYRKRSSRSSNRCGFCCCSCKR